MTYFPGNYSKSFTTPDFIEKIGYYSFGFSLIESIIFTQNVKTLEYYAFAKSCLKSVNIPNTLQFTRSSEFIQCKFLTEIILGNELKTITPECFLGTNISSIIFPEGLLTIGFTAFASCDNLRALTIPRSVDSIGGQCFPPLTVITFADGSPFFQDDQGLIYNSRTTLVLYLSERDSFTISSFVEIIHNSVFRNNNLLRTIIFEDESNIKEIANHAFRDCKNLTNIILPASLSNIGVFAF